MKLHEYIPQKSFSRLSGLLIMLIAAAVGFFSVPSLFAKIPLPWLFQLSGVLCLVAVIFITARYITKTIVYSLIENDEGGVDFCVTEISSRGRSQITVCRISIANIERAELFYTERAEDKARKKIFEKEMRKEKRKSFTYTPDPLCTPVALVAVNECGEPLLLRVAPDGTIWNYFNAKTEEEG